jgi:hypothetical protein
MKSWGFGQKTLTHTEYNKLSLHREIYDYHVVKLNSANKIITVEIFFAIFDISIHRSLKKRHAFLSVSF